MYTDHFALKEKPFSLLPDPGFLYLGRQHSSAYATLEYGVSSLSGITVITGEVGCGKTTLVRHLLNRLGDEVQVGLLSNTHRKTSRLLQWVLLAFDLDYRDTDEVAQFDTFSRFLVEQYAQGRRTVLIVDEAQNLEPETLEELRMLSNINADKDQVLQLVLVGQPELHRLLERHDLRQFAQRVAVSYHLQPLDEDEMRRYVEHRLTVAGGRPELFEPDALAAIQRAAGGIPRVINTLCDLALVYAFGADQHSVTVDTVTAVLADRRSARQANGRNQGDGQVHHDVTPLDRETASQLFPRVRTLKREPEGG